MMAALKVMTYFKISLSTHNWDRAIKKPAIKAGFFYATAKEITSP
ncbi:hypothetical protein ACEUC4_21420 [Aeromonas hydrophila]